MLDNSIIYHTKESQKKETHIINLNYILQNFYSLTYGYKRVLFSVRLNQPSNKYKSHYELTIRFV